MSEIRTLHINETEIAPRTKTKAVSNDNGTNLDELLAGKQATLVSGSNIKTINNQSVLGSGNLDFDSNVVHKTGNETINGKKTFKDRVDIDTVASLDEPLNLRYSIDDVYGMRVTTKQGGSPNTQTAIDFASGLEETVYINFPDHSGTLATTDDANAIIDCQAERPVVDDSNDSVLLRQQAVDLFYPKGTGIIGGHGSLDLNLAKNTGNKTIDYLINDLNSVGTNWVSDVTLREDQGSLRGVAVSSFIPFWTVKGTVNSGWGKIQFTLSKPVTSVTLRMTTGFNIATGGLIPSDYPALMIKNSINDTTTELDAAYQGEAPADVTRVNYPISSTTPFSSFYIEYTTTEGESVYDAKINLFHVEMQLTDTSTLYDWSKIADTKYVADSIAPVATTVSQHTTEIASLDTRETATESNVAELQEYVGDIQFEHVYTGLPSPGPEFAMKVFRNAADDNKFYQCLNDSELYILEGTFTGLTGTNVITENNKGDIEKFWKVGNTPAMSIVNINSNYPVYKDTNRIKFSSSSKLGRLCITPNYNNQLLNEVYIRVNAYHATKPSVITVEKYVNGTTYSLTTQQEITPGETTELTFTDLNIDADNGDYLIIRSDSYDTSQDRRLYIPQIRCTLGEDNYAWHNIVEGIDVSGKMDKVNPTGSGYFSFNRKANTTVGTNSIAMGLDVTSSGRASFAEGYNTTASNQFAHAEGNSTIASGPSSHAEGYAGSATAYYSHKEGYAGSASGISSHAEGQYTSATHASSHAEGDHSHAYNTNAHAEGSYTEASGSASHAEGYQTTATGNYSHGEGYLSNPTGVAAHAEGYHTIATGQYSHSEGNQGAAVGNYSHTEGNSTNVAAQHVTKTPEELITAWSANKFSLAKGDSSHVEGKNNLALGENSHAEGTGTLAQGMHSHTQGLQTVARRRSQFVFGEFNVEDTGGTTATDRGTYVEIVGNGLNAVSSNARTLDWDGNEVLAGKLTLGAEAENEMDAVTKSVTDALNENKQNKLIEGTGITITPGSEGDVIACSNPIHSLMTAIVGDGTTTTFTINHTFNTRDLMIQLYNLTDYSTVIADVTRTSNSAVTIEFKDAPLATESYRVMIMSFVPTATLVDVEEEEY